MYAWVLCGARTGYTLLYLGQADSDLGLERDMRRTELVVAPAVTDRSIIHHLESVWIPLQSIARIRYGKYQKSMKNSR